LVPNCTFCYCLELFTNKFVAAKGLEAVMKFLMHEDPNFQYFAIDTAIWCLENAHPQGPFII
jgi:hypothetical protein